MADLAGHYAHALERALAGPVAIMGISTGSSIAQQLAIDHPQLVDRLVLVAAACRLAPPQRRASRARVAARWQLAPADRQSRSGATRGWAVGLPIDGTNGCGAAQTKGAAPRQRPTSASPDAGAPGDCAHQVPAAARCRTIARSSSCGRRETRSRLRLAGTCWWDRQLAAA
jgi:pimeloyl-ACP methyl ester carboxylesterase